MDDKELKSKRTKNLFNALNVDDNDNIIAPFYTSFIEQKKYINRLTLYSFKVLKVLLNCCLQTLLI